jgi:hypothetical protein
VPGLPKTSSSRNTKVQMKQLHRVSWFSRRGRLSDLLPPIHTTLAITAMAMIAPEDRVKELPLCPEAPALLSPAPALEPASPAAGSKES